MKFGIFDHIERRRDVPTDQQYRERLDLIAQADKGGIHCYHLAEHHHSPLCLTPSQSIFLTAVAQRTERLLFGPLVYVLPLHHPIRLLEEICMLDNLSGGRFQIGFGKGAPVGEELLMWGGDPNETTELFDEAFQILMLGLTNDFLTFRGKHYSFRDLWMELKPKQKPYPPFWYAGSPANAGRYGANFIGRGTVKSLPDVAASYLEAWEKNRDDDDPSMPHVAEPLYGASKRVYLAETDDEAMARARTAYEVYRTNFAKPVPVGAEPHPKPVPLAPGTAPWEHEFDDLHHDEGLIIGSPETVKEYMERYANESDCNYFVASFQWGDLTHEEASRSLRLFTTEVMPRFADSAAKVSAD